MLQLKLVKVAVITFEDELQAIYFISNNGFRCAMFNVVGQALGTGVRFCLAPIVSEAQTRSPVLTKADGLRTRSSSQYCPAETYRSDY